MKTTNSNAGRTVKTSPPNPPTETTGPAARIKKNSAVAMKSGKSSVSPQSQAIYAAVLNNQIEAVCLQESGAAAFVDTWNRLNTKPGDSQAVVMKGQFIPDSVVSQNGGAK